MQMCRCANESSRSLRLCGEKNYREGAEDAMEERVRRESEIIPVLMTREAQMTTNDSEAQ